MQQEVDFYGVDVSSRWLDICTPDKQVIRIDNSVEAISKWLSSLSKPACIGMEATSYYHQLLAFHAFEAGHQVYVLNPRDVYHYAKGVGRRNKSDTVDAIVIRRYINREHEQLAPWSAPTALQLRVSKLIQRRSKVIVQRQALRSSCSDIQSQIETLEQAMNSLQALIDELESIIIAEVKSAYAEQFERLRSIPGVGKLTAAYFTNLLSHQSFSGADQLVSFLGMDLHFSDSGLKKGKRKLSKQGPSESRRLLFNCARAASQGKLKPMYQAYASRMNHTQATVAVMRKIIKLILGVWKTGVSFDMSRYQSPLMKNC